MCQNCKETAPSAWNKTSNPKQCAIPEKHQTENAIPKPTGEEAVVPRGWYSSITWAKSFPCKSLLHGMDLFDTVAFCSKALHKFQTLLWSVYLLSVFLSLSIPCLSLKEKMEIKHLVITTPSHRAWQGTPCSFQVSFKVPGTTSTSVTLLQSLLFLKKNSHPIRREFSPWEQGKSSGFSSPAVHWNSYILSYIFASIRSKECNS